MGNQLRKNLDLLSGRTNTAWVFGLTFFLVALIAMTRAVPLWNGSEWSGITVVGFEPDRPSAPALLLWLMRHWLILFVLLLASSSPWHRFCVVGVLMEESMSLGIALSCLASEYRILAPLAALLLLGFNLFVWLPILFLMCCKCWRPGRELSPKRDTPRSRGKEAVFFSFIVCSAALLVCVCLIWALAPYISQAVLRLSV